MLGKVKNTKIFLIICKKYGNRKNREQIKLKMNWLNKKRLTKKEKRDDSNKNSNTNNKGMHKVIHQVLLKMKQSNKNNS